MRIRNRLGFSICTMTLLVFFVGWVPTSVYALGLSPPTIEVRGLLRDTKQTRTVTLYRAPDEVGNVYIRVESDERHREFFVLDDPNLVMLEGQNEIDYTFGVIPGNAANGDYELWLRFLKTSDPKKFDSGAGVSVVTGVVAKVLLTIGGEEHLVFELKNIYAQETEEELEVPVVYVVDNTGNVDWKPEKIVFEFFNEAGDLAGSYELTGDEIPLVKAGQVGQQFTVRIPVSLARGRHTIKAAFWKGETQVGQLASDQVFDVYAPGTLAQSGMLKGLSVNKPSFAPDEQVKVNAIFLNNGQVDITARLVLEVIRNGEITDLLYGDEFVVAHGEEFVFSRLYKPAGKGSYEINGHIEYAKRQTPITQIAFEVQSASKSLDFLGRFLNSEIGLAVVAVVLVVATLLVIVVFRRRRGANTIPPPISSTPVSPKLPYASPETTTESKDPTNFPQ